MGQQECINKLSKDKWMTTKQLSKKLNQVVSSVSRSLAILYKNGDVLRKEVKRDNGVSFQYAWRLKNEK